MTHLTTSLTGEILGNHRQGPGPAKPAEREKLGRIIVGMTIAVLALTGLSLVGARLLGLI
ncbi:hypothetical protein AB0I28_14515 [Phytomonospora sp. NPDC050363]|uniref:hypothetical protein n=1 Tax=Phytomonospora sp. NPDC050363 TaxID=3155642 RepID=UPI0033F6A7CF